MKSRHLALLALLLIVSSEALAALAAMPPPIAQASSSTITSPLSDPYANFSGYQSYLQSFYQPSMNGFRAYPVSDPSGGDYYNYWMDDAGKMLTSFAALNDTTYASHAANFIMDNTINDSGFLYTPERVVNYSGLTYLHVNTSQTASPDFPITYTPVLNPGFESENTSAVNGVAVNQPISWNSYLSGSAAANDENVQALSSDGTHYASTNVTSTGGVSAYYQKMDVPNYISVYAHNDPGIGENNGIVGNYTASYLAASSSDIVSTNASNQMVWSYVSYPAFSYDTIFPANSEFQLTTYISANQSLTGVTYGVQVNEVCNGYSNETSPWGGEVASTINVGTTPTAYTASVSTGTSNFVFNAGCALHFIIYLNPNTSHYYTFSINYDSRSYETHAVVPYLPTVSRLSNENSTFGFTLKPYIAPTGYFVSLVTSAGSLVLATNGVDVSSIPNLVSPVKVINFSITTPMQNWTTFNYNAASLASTAGLSPDGIIEYLEFGVNSIGTTSVYASWDDVFYITSVGEGNSPLPGSNEYLVGGYYYATNGIIGLSNVSTFQNLQVYEKSMSAAIITATENSTTFGYLLNPSVKQAFGSSPFISDFFVWDTDNNASGLMSRQIFPYSITVGSVPYRLYVSGGNGSNINIDFWIGVDTYQNVYIWINATIAAGQDYIQPSMTMFNLGVNNIQLNDLNYGLGSFDSFFRYNPYWSWLQLSNGTIVKTTHGFNDTTAYPNSTIYSTSKYGSNTPQALLFTGFNTPEFTDGLLIKPLQPNSVGEIDYVNNFFGHSLRIVMNENGKIIPPGGQSDTFSFQFTPLAKTMWTEPSVLLYAFENAALTKPGVDISMPGTWGFDDYGLAYWGAQSNNATVLSFARELWNSQYQDVIQRLHVATPYNPTAQPVIYYRSLYAYATSGLMLFPGNATVLSFAEQAAQYAITDQLNPYGLPFGLEEDGWAVHLLGQLYAAVPNSPTLQSTYAGDINEIITHIAANSTFVPQTLSSWNVSSSSALSYTPSVYNFNSTGQINPGTWCNHPNIVFRCGEMTYGMMNASMISGLTNYWSNPAFLTSFSLIQEMTNPQPSGLSVDVRYADNSGNSNTETQPVTVLGILAWMEAMQQATGTFIANVQGAGIQSIQYNTYESNQYNSLIIGLSVPTGKTANITINYAGKGGPPEHVYDNNIPITNYQLNKTSGDIILTDVASQIMLLWPSSGSSSGGSNTCGSSATPTITDPVIYAQIGKSTIANVSISNAGDNASALIGGLTFRNNTGTGNVTISSYSGLPQTVEADNYGSFKLQVTILNGTKPGNYTEFATSDWNGVCPDPSETSASSGQIGFGITIIAQNVTHPHPRLVPWWIEYWWVETIVGIVLLILFLAVVKIRYFDD